MPEVFFPYDWVDSHDKLAHIGLPAMVEFYPAHKQEHVSVENYEHAVYVYEKMNCSKLEDYLLEFFTNGCPSIT